MNGQMTEWLGEWREDKGGPGWEMSTPASWALRALGRSLLGKPEAWLSFVTCHLSSEQCSGSGPKAPQCCQGNGGFLIYGTQAVRGDVSVPPAKSPLPAWMLLVVAS
uniref:Uncharacterized protein n=1 Tax=Mus musculus TaxID=10090 RepID=Q3UH29_MOUSE|nr:unnamed protein product [Mus musculus]